MLSFSYTRTLQLLVLKVCGFRLGPRVLGLGLESCGLSLGLTLGPGLGLGLGT